MFTLTLGGNRQPCKHRWRDKNKTNTELILEEWNKIQILGTVHMQYFTIYCSIPFKKISTEFIWKRNTATGKYLLYNASVSKIIKGEGGSDQRGNKRNYFSFIFLKQKMKPISILHLFA